MAKHLTKSESKLLNYLYGLQNVQRARYGKRDFAFKLSELFDKCPTATKKAELARPISRSKWSINKAKLIRVLKRNNKMLRLGYLKKGRSKNLVGVVLDKSKGVSIKGMRPAEFISGRSDKSTAVFKISGTDLSVIGNRNRLVKAINNRLGYRYAREPRVLCSTSPNEKLKDLLTISQKDPNVKIYKIQYNDLKEGKKLRVFAYSDGFDILDNFLKLNFDKKADNRRLIISIGLTDKQHKATLKITRLNENQYLLRWKDDNDLSKYISTLLAISNEDTIVVDTTDDKNLLSDLFRNQKIDWYDARNVYKRILSSYSRYIELGKRNDLKLRYRNIIEDIQQRVSSSGCKVETIKLVKRSGFYFPSSQNKVPEYKMLRISKSGRTVQHILLNHEELYWSGNEETIKRFFVFSPFIILDFRKNSKREFESSWGNDYVFGSGEFIYNLKNDTPALLATLKKEGRSLISKFTLSDHYKVALKLLNDVNTYKLNPQQKGALFEAICFIILSKIFLTRKLGGSLKADGKFLLNNNKVVYDAKNIGPRTSFLESVTRYGKIKDIEYIKQEKTNEYIYIATQIDAAEFSRVKTDINNEVPSCKVSAITVNALKDLTKFYDIDNRRFDRTKFEQKLLSGTLITSLTENDVLADASQI